MNDTPCQPGTTGCDDDAAISILYVEDEDFDNAVFRRLARESRKGVRTCHVMTIAEARERMKRQNFDLLFVDNGLPDGSGVEFAVEVVDAGLMNWNNVVVLTGGLKDVIKQTYDLRIMPKSLAKDEMTTETLRSVFAARSA
ncbi:response regulator [Mangrovicoccus sp. HB161399]|uniref:response regulator n=1 Tax=Mangrovicoccus sp. HB161399 TaxID=2720392 RepID=UPI0015582F6F|nr:response regulator [Mangrovicoccus sp. HB161399]